MLSYQHAFHAGNHADILKHITLISVLKSLNKKEKPYTFFDTHAGSGLYDLLDSRILKTQEAENGILKLIELLQSEKDDIPQSLKDYLSFLTPYLKNNLYPGSPLIEKSFARKNDEVILSELHPAEIENLRENIKKNSFGNSMPKISVHKRSGWEMIQALTPPKTSRGAVLIDPSYEEDSDYVQVSSTVCNVLRKWSNGIIMIWYPLLTHRVSERNLMFSEISDFCAIQNKNTEICDIQLKVFEPDETRNRLYGSGMYVINPPYLMKDNVSAAIDIIEKLLYQS